MYRAMSPKLKQVSVAETLDISDAAVKTRLYRAREMFRRVYRGGDAG